MATTNRIPIKLILVFVTLNYATSATFDSVKASSTKACQLTVDNCKALAQEADKTLVTDCQLMTATVNGVTANQCLVKIGLCTEIEFVKLKNAACSGTDSEQQSVSQAKTAVYTTLNSASDSCKNRALNCIMSSGVAIVLKQSEQYCDLFKINTSELCLTNNAGCTADEFNNLKKTACTSPAVTAGRFATAVNATSLACKNAMDSCCTPGTALAYVQSEQYCQVMNINNNGASTSSCLVGGTKCTSSEFDQLKQAACSGAAVYMGWVTLLTCLICGFLNL